MKFLIDRCTGRRLAEWLRLQGHDVVEALELGPDPGDRALLAYAADNDRILVTIDTDFGEFIYARGLRHSGVVRLPDVPAQQRISLMSELIERRREALETQAIVTIRNGRIRVSRPPSLQ